MEDAGKCEKREENGTGIIGEDIVKWEKDVSSPF
jgi:hypothetical protein